MNQEPKVTTELEQAADRMMWLPISDGRAIPDAFWTHIDDPASDHIVHMQVRATAGRTWVRQIVVSQREGSWPFGPPVTAASFRKVNVGRLLRLAIDDVARPRRDVEAGGLPRNAAAFTVEGVSTSKGAFVSPRSGGRGSRTTPERLDEVARVYLEAKGEGLSTRAAIKAHFHVEDSQAARLVRAARDAGKLRK